MNNSFETITNFSMIQTFYADPDIVNNSGTVTLTSVDLFFKPLFTVPGVTGKANPSVIVRICELTENDPDLSKVFSGVYAIKSYNEIAPGFSDASSSVTFGFNKPLIVPTGRFYGIVITFEDPAFELWTNRLGDKLIGTNNASPGSNLVKDGKLYLSTNAGSYRPQSDSDLKFALKCAQYVANTVTEVYIPNNYEFFTITNTNGRFVGGEYVFQQVANSSGNVQFTAGTTALRSTTSGGADFNTAGVVAGDQLVLWSNSSYKDVVEVLNVVNTSYLETTSTIVHSNTGTNWMKPPVGQVHYYSSTRRKLYLKGSNAANTAFKFQANNNLLYGEDSLANCKISSVDSISADRIKLNTDLTLPSKGVIDKRLTFAYKSGASFLFTYNNQIKVGLNESLIRNINQYDAFIQSRSLEIDNSNLPESDPLDGGGNRINRPSVVANTTLTVNASNVELYVAPSMDQSQLDMFVITNLISNTYTTTDANSVVIDSEVGGPYNAESKHITTKVSFANNRFAEDVRVYMTAYRPANTDILVYARVHNSADPDAFDDRAWSPLQYKENAERFSSKDDESDYVEYELGLPLYSDSANVLPGTFTTTLTSNTLVAAGVNPSSYLAAGDVVKLYNPLIPEDYIVDVVSVVNSSAIQLETAVSNNNVVGTGFKVDRLKYYNAAFNNITNDNVCRYYNSSLVTFDKFNAMQVKIVFLGDNTYLAPKIDQISVIGVSA
jgi:hypothetical protein